MKLEIGKYYRTAEGEKVGPMLLYKTERDAFHFVGDEDGRLWKSDGTRRYGDSDGVIVAEWSYSKFKVGDRVRVSGGHTPEFGVIAFEDRDDTWLVYFEGWGEGHNGLSSGLSLYGDNHYWIETRRLSPAPTLTIQAGKFYKTRDGRKVGPMYASGKDNWPWAAGDGSANNLWKDSGQWYPFGNEDKSDLIAEWADEPVAVAALVVEEGKTYFDAKGNTIGPMRPCGSCFYVVSGNGQSWRKDGSVNGNAGNPSPLVGEYVATPAIPTIGDWVKDSDGRIGIVFYDAGDDWDNLYVGWTDDGDWETVGAKYLTIVPPGTKPDKPVPTPANDNYEVGDIVEIVDTGIFGFSVSVGDIAAVTDTDGDISIRVQTKDGPVDQVVFLENASHIRPYRRTA